MALQKGRENVSWGFTLPKDGWHTCSFQEGVNLAINENTGKQSLYIPLMVDEGGTDDGCKIAVFISTRDENGKVYKNAEQNIADVITNAGLFDMFAERFSDATSWLDPRIIEAMKIKLLGHFVMVETEVSKDQNNKDRCNVRSWAPKGTVHEDKKASAKDSKKKTTPGDANSGW